MQENIRNCSIAVVALVVVLLTLVGPACAGRAILVDMTHGERLEIDGTGSNLHIGDPKYSVISNATAWADDMRAHCYTVDLLTTGPISATSLSGYDEFAIICPDNITTGPAYFTQSEADAIMTFVNNGHGLLLIGDNLLGSGDTMKNMTDEYDAPYTYAEILNDLTSRMGLNVTFGTDVVVSDVADERTGGPKCNVWAYTGNMSHALWTDPNSFDRFSCWHTCSIDIDPTYHAVAWGSDTMYTTENNDAYTPVVKPIGSNPIVLATAEPATGTGRIVFLGDAAIHGTSPAITNDPLYKDPNYHLDLLHQNIARYLTNPPLRSCDAISTEKYEFWPDDGVYAKGCGLLSNTQYKLWIQNATVNEGDALDAGEDPSGVQETVTTDTNGNFGPILIWSIPSDSLANRLLYRDYNIVADNQGSGTAGTYHDADDSIIDFEVELPQVWNLSINTNRTLAEQNQIELTWEGRAYAYDIRTSGQFPCAGDAWGSGAWDVADTCWINDANSSSPYSDPIYATPVETYYKVVNAGEDIGEWGEVVGKYDVNLAVKDAWISVPHQVKVTDISEVLKYSHWPGVRLEGGSPGTADFVFVISADGSSTSNARLMAGGSWYGAVDLQSNKAFHILTEKGIYQGPNANVTLRLFLEG